MNKIIKLSFFVFFVPLLIAQASDISFGYNYPISSGALDNTDYAVMVDSDSGLHAVYVIGGQIKYRHNLDTEETVATGISPSLTIDPSTKEPAVAFIVGGYVNYAWRSTGGSWQTYQVATGTAASLATDGLGITHIAYLNDSDGDTLNEVFYTNGYGQTFAPSTLLANGAYCNDLSCRVTDDFLNPNIRVDSNNHYHLEVLERYRNNTLVPNYQDYLSYFGSGVSSQGNGQTAESLNLRNQFLTLDSAGLPLVVWVTGSTIKTSTFNPNSLTWSDQSLPVTGTSPSFYSLAGLQSLVYEDGSLVNYREATSSGFGPAVVVATGTKPYVLADNYRYVYYLDGGQLYLASNREVPDVTAPTATFVSKPDSPITATSAHFVIGGADVLAYKYKLDSGSFGSEILVANAFDLNNLDVGNHTVSVIGRDGSGNWQAESSATTYTWTINTPTISTGGGGGGGGGASSATTTPSLEPIGRVLGASTFQFSRVLRVGMSGADVQELQKILQKSGFLKVKTITKYFGPATQKALIAWKKKNKIKPFTGVLSKPNLKYLNSLKS